MKTVYLLRHGEIPASSPRLFLGRTEVSLTDRGRAQMEQAAGYLQAARIERLVCSPLRRSAESAAILGKAWGLAVEPEPALSEIDLGDWEGLSVAQVRQRYPGDYEARGRDIALFRPQAGESFTDLQDRVWPAFLAILDGAAETTAVVAHAGVNRVLLCRLLGIPLAHLFQLRQDYACLNIVRRRAGLFQLELLNLSPGILPLPSSPESA